MLPDQVEDRLRSYQRVFEAEDHGRRILGDTARPTHGRHHAVRVYSGDIIQIPRRKMSLNCIMSPDYPKILAKIFIFTSPCQKEGFFSAG